MGRHPPKKIATTSGMAEAGISNPVREAAGRLNVSRRENPAIRPTQLNDAIST